MMKISRIKWRWKLVELNEDETELNLISFKMRELYDGNKST